MTVTLPSIRYESARVRLLDFGAAQEGALGGPDRQFARLGERHGAEFVVSPCAGVDASAFLGAVLKARSSRTTIRAPLMQPPAVTDMVASITGVIVDGADQTGNTLDITGLVPATGGRTNLILYSEQFQQSVWAAGATHVTVNADVDPSPPGATTADKIVEDTSTNSHRVLQDVSIASGSPVTLSCYFLQGGRPRVMIWTTQSGTEKTATFDLAGGSVLSADTGVTGHIEDAGGGWWRCGATLTPGATMTEIGFFLVKSDGSTTYTGDNTSGIYAWGAQLEAGSSMTAYIGPTTTSSVSEYDGDAVIPAGAAFSGEVSGTSYLYIVTDDVTPDGSGNATLNLDCLLRASFADGAALEFAAPVIEGFLPAGDLAWTVDRIALDGLDFSIKERV